MGGLTIIMAGRPRARIAGVGVSTALLFAAAGLAQSPDAGETLAKIRFDLSRLNDSGLIVVRV